MNAGYSLWVATNVESPQQRERREANARLHFESRIARDELKAAKRMATVESKKRTKRLRGLVFSKFM